MARANNSNQSNNKMNREEAGRLGGEATSQSHDSGFYEEIGSEGGEKSGGNFKNDTERAQEAGKKGGKATGNR